MNEEKAIELLKAAMGNEGDMVHCFEINSYSGEIPQGNEAKRIELIRLTLSLLQQPTCEKCGGSGKITEICTPHENYPRTTRRKIPCPTCQPSAGEFVKRVKVFLGGCKRIKNLDDIVGWGKLGDAMIPLLREACNLLTEPTKIESKWWDKSIMLVEGCTPVSEACKHCWSAAITHRFHQDKGLTTNGHYNNKIVCREDRLDEILKRKKPTRWTIWNDLFHPSVPFEFIGKVFDVIQECPQHTFQILTKQPEIAYDFFGGTSGMGLSAPPLKNLWLGVTAENQKCADERIPILLQIPAAIRFVSCEPLLGKVDLEKLKPSRNTEVNALDGWVGNFYKRMPTSSSQYNKGIDWVIVGCESGPKKRYCELQWIRDIVGQCKAANVPVFVKQIHKEYPLNHKGSSFYVSKDMSEFPKDLRMRQWPNDVVNVKK